MLERAAPLPSPVLAGQELSRWRRTKRRPGVAEKPRRDAFAATARLNGRVAEGAKGPLGGGDLNRCASPGESD